MRTYFYVLHVYTQDIMYCVVYKLNCNSLQLAYVQSLNTTFYYGPGSNKL